LTLLRSGHGLPMVVSIQRRGQGKNQPLYNTLQNEIRNLGEAVLKHGIDRVQLQILLIE